MDQEGLMTSKALPGAGDVRNAGPFRYKVPHFQLYDSPYELLDRFQLQELAKRLGRPIKTRIDARGRSTDPGKDKLVDHFIALEGMGHVRRETALPVIEAIWRETMEKRMAINGAPVVEEEPLAVEDSDKSAEIARVALMPLKALKAEAKRLGLEPMRREKREAMTQRILTALGIQV